MILVVSLRRNYYKFRCPQNVPWRSLSPLSSYRQVRVKCTEAVWSLSSSTFSQMFWVNYYVQQKNRVQYGKVVWFLHLYKKEEIDLTIMYFGNHGQRERELQCNQSFSALSLLHFSHFCWLIDANRLQMAENPFSFFFSFFFLCHDKWLSMDCPKHWYFCHFLVQVLCQMWFVLLST